MPITFDNSYIKLPKRFYSKQAPVPVSNPDLIAVNHPLAEYLGINAKWLESSEGVNIIAGNQMPEGSEPIATVYAGHQFGQWNPRLGDGRAVLLGEVIAQDGERYDIQLKGSGITPYSRSGDGRAPLGPVIREYLVSEAMAALGIPTTRTLAAVTTGDPVFRESRLDGGVLARVAKSHIRIGTLQYFASIEDIDGLKLLLEHIIQRHYPKAADADNPILAMFEQVMHRQAYLISRWQSIGFIHGVMNTDNMLLSGETIDYGPCAFMDSFNSAALYSSIDHQGRYAYHNQPAIAHWNLVCLAQTLLPLLDADETKATELAQTAINSFPDLYQEYYVTAFSKKLGLADVQDSDDKLIQNFLDLLENNQCDFTLAFRRLGELPVAASTIKPLFDFPDAFTEWLERWRLRYTQEQASIEERHQQMMTVNPVFIPRNHLVEESIQKAYAGDFSMFHQMHGRLSSPFEFDTNDQQWAMPPRPDQVVQQTFCGT